MKRELIRVIAGFSVAAASASCGAEPGSPAGAGGAQAGASSAAVTGGNAPGNSGGSSSAGATAATGGTPGTSGAPSVGGMGGGGMSASAGASATSGGGGLSATGGTGSAGTSAGGAGGSVKSAGCGVMDHPASGTAMIDVAGTSREYILKLPEAYDANTPYKLVFGWHWRSGSAKNVADGQLGGGPYYGLEKLAKGTTIFVAPNGIDEGWANTGGRDIAFLKAMLTLFTSKLCIDQAHIFSTGFSYGGMMSDAIGCDMADVFRAIAPMSGALYSGCTRTNTQPIALWMSHGNNDDVVPLADGKTALDIFLKKNGCGSQTSAAMPSPCVAYQGCSAGHPVTYCEFDGGHAPPSFASSAIWDFFSQF